VKFVYFIWLLLPLSFLIIWLWATARRIAKAYGVEDTQLYFRQFVFTTIALVVAVGTDQLVGEMMSETLSTEYFDFDIVRWLLYPAILLLGSYIKPRKKKQA
jgi:hypothetical protein